MANLPESSTFDAGVYQLELTDPVIGGPSGISNAPLKNLANRTKYLKDQVDLLTSNKAPLSSPAFTGTPTVPTAAAGTNTTQAASTAFVTSAISTAAPDLTPYAPKANPVFSGNPLAPTPAQFDNDTSLATTAFVKASGKSFAGVATLSSATTLDSTYAGKLILLAGQGYAITLPPASSFPAGACLSFLGYGWVGGNTIQRAGSDFVYPNGVGGGQTAISLGYGETLTLVSNGASAWFVADGNATQLYSQSFGASLSGSGYQKLPSGLIMQWGSAIINAGANPPNYGNATVTFPIAFPNYCLSCLITSNTTGLMYQAYEIEAVTNISKTQATIWTGSDRAASYFYLALGI